ncbi:MAG: transglutaminase-like domain-containing protein [candidate division Zixibacteria bacterium]|nr:transglutaminase-like domain-containing protein [candidate division Zixibacteria bacterium]MDH3938102.1 transglutaminase-like domain-containing protein [candidate division Zixibacteria bacterium]MDH4032965.1 transglutaminase-like domain-containing protein [candidate division Zixibacteria bacterium]
MTLTTSIRLFFMASIGLILTNCSTRSYLPDEVALAIDAAGDNGSELKSVIAHYQASDDSLKLRAAFFLIGNMEGHGWATYDLVDTVGNEIAFDVSLFPNYDSLTSAFATLEAEYGVLDFEKNDLQPDLETVSADHLISQIDLAFRAWRERPWAEHLSFDDFCQYVLPYRGSNEPLEPWRAMFFDKYSDLADRMIDSTDPVEAACLINDDVMTFFTFDPRYYYHPTDLGLTEMLQTGVGRCEDMTNITIYAMRANGLAVTSDYTPAWADAGNNHAWNAIIAADGSAIPFMGAEKNPRKYELGHRPAKVYRKTFSHQRENLVFQEHKQEKLPAWLGGKSYVDVTASYQTDLLDRIETQLEIPAPDSVDIAYLCVFNSGEWKPIDWARVMSHQAVFSNVRGNLLYLPAFYINEEVVPYGPPFVNDSENKSRQFRSVSDATITLSLTSTTRRKQVASTDGIERSYLTAGVEYELFYWDDEWESLGKAVSSEKPLLFDNVPVGTLYWLVAEGSDRDERPFSWEDGAQRWW